MSNNLISSDSFKSFFPVRKTLMGPGPSDVSDRVLGAMARPTLGHLDPDFLGMMEEIKTMLRYAYQTENPLTFPVSAPGSAGMEICFVNLVEPEDKILVCVNGVFGGRMVENVKRSGGIPVIVEDEWGTPVSPDKVEKALGENPDVKVVAFVHAETSTGALSDAAAISAVAKKHGKLVLMDCVTSLSGVPVMLDKWGIDAAYSGTQKCLSCPPGLSPVSFSENAIEKIRNRKSLVRSWFLDLNLVLDYWNAKGGKRSYHHTAPINLLYALHESLVILCETGLEKSWENHRTAHLSLKAELEKIGLEYLVEEKYRLPQLNSVKVPNGVDEAKVRKVLLEDFNLEIGAGLGPLAGKIWRIGLMGHAARQDNVNLCVLALKTALGK